MLLWAIVIVRLTAAVAETLFLCREAPVTIPGDLVRCRCAMMSSHVSRMMGGPEDRFSRRRAPSAKQRTFRDSTELLC